MVEQKVLILHNMIQSIFSSELISCSVNYSFTTTKLNVEISLKITVEFKTHNLEGKLTVERI